MRKEIKIPDIAENVKTGLLSNILVSVGDTVETDQSLVEVETDKATADIPSPFAGKIAEINVKEGDEVEVGQVIMTIEVDEEGEGETEAEEKGEEVEEKEVEKTGEEVKAKAEVMEEEAEGKEQEKVREKTGTEEKAEAKVNTVMENKAAEVPAAPSVRKLARELGFTISDIKGTGPGKRITHDDVKNYSRQLQEGRGKSTMPTEQLPDFSIWGETERKPMNRIRELTAENMQKSWNTIPHVTQFDKAEITLLEEFRRRQSKVFEKEERKLTLTSIMVRVATLALKKFPVFNSSIDFNKKEIVLKKYINIGIAVDTENGLMVPVIRNADKKTLSELAAEIADLAKKARTKKISVDELQGGNFTISNLGGIGGTNFTPIIYAPQVAILGLSKAITEPVWNDDEFMPGLMLPLALSYDHRVIDGADGTKFLTWIKNVVENPYNLLL